MVVFILESVPPALRGDLSKWMLEPKAGVFVGRVSALVREKLWEKACQACRLGGCTMIYRMNNEQGYIIETFGSTRREVVEMDGLQLIKIPKS